MNLSDKFKEHFKTKTVSKTQKVIKNELGQKSKVKGEVIKIYNLEQSKHEIKRLKKEGAKFEVWETTNSCKIKVLKEKKTVTYWYIESTKSDYFLILLNEIKKEMRERETVIVNSPYSKDPKETKYFFFAKAFNDVKGDAGSCYEFDNVYEADVSHAYYRAAYVLGFISKGLYLKIINGCSKHDRLRLLGCIATVKLWQSYEGSDLIDGDTLKDDLLRNAWFKICNYIDCALLEFRDKLGKNFLFYWVDGIYFKHDTKLPDVGGELNFFKHIRSVKYKYDLDFKVIPIKKFVLINKDDTIEIQVTKPDGTVKPFFPPRSKVKSYSFEGLNNI